MSWRQCKPMLIFLMCYFGEMVRCNGTPILSRCLEARVIDKCGNKTERNVVRTKKMRRKSESKNIIKRSNIKI